MPIVPQIGRKKEKYRAEISEIEHRNTVIRMSYTRTSELSLVYPDHGIVFDAYKKWATKLWKDIKEI